MERESLSFRQLMVLLWAGMLGPAAEMLPGPAGKAGAAGLTGLLAAGLALALAGNLLWRVAAPAEGLAAGLRNSLGSWALYLYIIWGEVLLSVRLRLSAQRLAGAGSRDGTVWFFLLVLALFAAWMGRGRLGALGRTAEMMFGALVLTAGAVLVLALFQTRGLNLLGRPWETGRGATALQALSVASCGLFAAFLIQPRNMERQGKSWLRWTAGGCAALALGELIILGSFGPELTARLEVPFLQLAKSVGVEGAFQRAESVAAALWSFSDLLLLAEILWGMRQIGSELGTKLSPCKMAGAAVLPAAVCALAFLDWERGRAVMMLLPLGGAALGIVLPLAALGARGRKGRK